MATIKTYGMPNSSILRIYSDMEIIKIDPQYQRKGDVWSIEKKQLLVDSILNEYDIPKLYFHSFSKEQKNEESGRYEYAIIDGRQRIQAIYEFIDGSFGLSEDFEYLADTSIKAGGLSYLELATNFPKLKIRFDSFTLPIILVETEDLDLIEDMFSRLNEAVPLNASEKRNALGGYMAKIIREVSNHSFFTKNVRFKNNRLQYNEVAAKILFIEYSLLNASKIVDTKKPYLDKMVQTNMHRNNISDMVYENVQRTLNIMVNVFENNDPLLRTQSPVTIYYLLFREALFQKKVKNISRQGFIDFYYILERNRKEAEKDITLANFELLEFDRLSQQGTNDASSIKERTRILSEFFLLDCRY